MSTFIVIGIVAILLLALCVLIALTDPQRTVEKDVDVNVNGQIVKHKVQTRAWSPTGSAIEIIGLPLMILVGILLFVLIVPSDTMIQTRLGFWRLFGENNPDNAHSVYDPPENMEVTEGQVIFEIPQGTQPNWIVVTVEKEDKTYDSKSVPLDCMKQSNDSGRTVRTVTYKNKAISPTKPLKAMYGIATGPSAEAVWTPSTDAS